MNNIHKNKDILFIDILKIISMFGVYFVHLIISLKVNQFDFLPSGEGLQVNFNNFFNGQSFYQEEWKLLIFIPQAIAQLGWQGVHIFLFCSGFGLYFSYLNFITNRSKHFSWFEWIKLRLNRLLPKYFLIVTVFFLIQLIYAFLKKFAFSDICFIFLNFILSITLLRSFFDFSFFYFAGALWFIPLIIEMYIVFPFLCNLLNQKRCWSLVNLFLVVCAVSLFYRFLVSLDPCAMPVPFQKSLDCVNPSVVQELFSGKVPYGTFISRLPEFLLGIIAAHTYFYHKFIITNIYHSNLKRLIVFICGLILWCSGNLFCFFRSTWFLCDLFICLGLIFLSFRECLKSF